jgi:hypothetical protein
MAGAIARPAALKTMLTMVEASTAAATAEHRREIGEEFVSTGREKGRAACDVRQSAGMGVPRACRSACQHRAWVVPVLSPVASLEFDYSIGRVALGQQRGCHLLAGLDGQSPETSVRVVGVSEKRSQDEGKQAGTCGAEASFSGSPRRAGV